MMVAKVGFCALALSAALATASVAVLSDEAMAQSADVAVQAEEAIAEAPAAAPQADDVTMQDEAVEQQPVPKSKPTVAERPAKSDLNQSAVRAAPVTRLPRPTRTSTRAIVVPRILGSYR